MDVRAPSSVSYSPHPVPLDGSMDGSWPAPLAAPAAAWQQGAVQLAQVASGPRIWPWALLAGIGGAIAGALAGYMAGGAVCRIKRMIGR